MICKIHIVTYFTSLFIRGVSIYKSAEDLIISCKQRFKSLRRSAEQIRNSETEEDRQKKRISSVNLWVDNSKSVRHLPSVAEKYRFGNENIVPDFEQDAGFQLLRTYTLIDRFWEDHTTRRAFYIALEKESLI